MTDTARTDDREHGFTIIELMIVVLIIAILIAIAVPTFLASRNRAEDRHAESLVHDGIVAAKIVFSDTQTFSGLTPAQLHGAEAEVAFVPAGTTASAQAQQVSVGTGTANGQGWIVLTSASQSGSCFAALELDGSGTYFQKTTGTPCAASGFGHDPTAGGWVTGGWPSG